VKENAAVIVSAAQPNGRTFWAAMIGRFHSAGATMEAMAIVPHSCLALASTNPDRCSLLIILNSFTPAGSRLAATLTSVCASWNPPQHPRPPFASSGYLTFGRPACRATFLLVPTSRPFARSTIRQLQTCLSCLLSHTTLWAYIKSSG
jgi:hypothetical protein